MRFSRHFGIELDQSSLDFVDIELDSDTELYVDPYAIATRRDEWSFECAALVNRFFQEIINAIRAGNEARAMALLSNLHEPNETRLGLSRGIPSGRGVGGLQATQLYQSLSQSTAVQTGFVEDLADCELVVEGIGPDKISDITTNVIRGKLIEYTQQQCRNFDVPIRQVVSGPIWDLENAEWCGGYADLPVVDGRAVVLVPKFAVRWNVLLRHGDYYRHFVLNFMRDNATELGLAYLATRTGAPTKKSLSEEFPLSKRFLLEFSRDHPEVFRQYKQHQAAAPPITDDELAEGFDRFAMANFLSRRLNEIPVGREGETAFHRHVAGILTFLFYPNLLSPRIEERINEGRKRIDITFVNGANSGLFRRFTAVTGKPALKILAECKNYRKDAANEEVDQLLGRFDDTRGWLGLLLSRTTENRQLMDRRCRDVARSHRGFIINLDDSDIHSLLEISARSDESGVNQYLEQRFNVLTS